MERNIAHCPWNEILWKNIFLPKLCDLFFFFFFFFFVVVMLWLKGIFLCPKWFEDFFSSLTVPLSIVDWSKKQCRFSMIVHPQIRSTSCGNIYYVSTSAAYNRGLSSPTNPYFKQKGVTHLHFLCKSDHAPWSMYRKPLEVIHVK